MNANPNLSVVDNPWSSRRLTLAIVVLIAGGLMLASGCADSDAAKGSDRPVPADPAVMGVTQVVAQTDSDFSATTATKATGNGSLQDDQDETTEKPATGVLGKASELFGKAKSKSGSTAAGASQWVQDKLGGAADAGNQTADETWKWANETFDSLKAQGLTSAKDTSEWLGEDWHNMESWEYKVITLAGTDDELAEKLNEYGKQGWNCFNTESSTDGVRFYLKKPIFSYLRHLPFKDVIKLVPMMTNGEK